VLSDAVKPVTAAGNSKDIVVYVSERWSALFFFPAAPVQAQLWCVPKPPLPSGKGV
jgi:hypothetical protein